MNEFGCIAVFTIFRKIQRMNSLQIRLLSLVCFAAFCATITYWVVTLSSHPASVPAAAARQPVSVDQAATLFGGQLTRTVNQDIRLFGILALRQGAAAIISVGGEPPHTVSLGGAVMQGTRLSEVRARSIIIDHNGVHSEVTLPNPAPGPTIYVR
jgi:general secretion pathway protein C